MVVEYLVQQSILYAELLMQPKDVMLVAFLSSIKRLKLESFLQTKTSAAFDMNQQQSSRKIVRFCAITDDGIPQEYSQIWASQQSSSKIVRFAVMQCSLC